MILNLKIKTEQRPDTYWKAWDVDGTVEAYSKTKENAVNTVKIFLESRALEQTKDFYTTHQEMSL